MPFYEYRCQGCGHQIEVLQKMSDKPLLVCSDCGASQMKKLMSVSADISSAKQGPACAGGDVSSTVPPCVTGGCGGCPTR